MSFLQKRNFPIKNLKYGYQKRQKEAAGFTDFSIVKATAPHSLFATIFFTDHFTRLLLSHSSPLTVSSDIHSAVPHTAP